METAAEVVAELEKRVDPVKAAFYPKFFKAGPGQYAEGDRFLGVTVPKQRKIARPARFLPLSEIEKLLKNPYHECRLTALFILVEQFRVGEAKARSLIVDFYLSHLDQVNNWDLVDASAHKILGEWLVDKDRKTLYELARCGHLWRQRVSMVACLTFIKRRDFEDPLHIAELLLDHPHDLIHKAVGWMLRELGKVEVSVLENFLKTRYQHMPRTMLRYAIEKFEPARREAYLAGKI